MPGPTYSRSAPCSTKWRPARCPFRGDTTAAIFDAILNKSPAPPSGQSAGSAAELERIVNKALEKDLELRYQSAAEMRSDFKRLKRETDSGRSAAVIATPTGEKKKRAYPNRGGHSARRRDFAAIAFIALRGPLPPPRVLSATNSPVTTCPKNARHRRPAPLFHRIYQRTARS